jgi:hypothetical protein
MVRAGLLALLTTICLSTAACVPWQNVPTTIDPAASTDPILDMKTIINTTTLVPPALLEVTEQYLKAVWPQGYTQVFSYAQAADIRIIHRGDIFQVSAYDAAGKEFFAFRPRMHDFATCQKFLNAFYALTKRPVPTPAAVAGGGATPPSAAGTTPAAAN